MLWMAGVMDSGASCFTYNRPRDVRPQICISVREGGGRESIVVRLCSLTGIGATHGSPSPDYDKRPCAEHCIEPHQHVTGGSVGLIWAPRGVRAEIILYNCSPFMVTRTPLLPDQDPIWKGGMQAKAARDMQSMGWELPWKVPKQSERNRKRQKVA